MDKKTAQKKALIAAIARYPTLKSFAAALGVPYQVVQQWRTNGVPPPYCPEIEKITKGATKCEDLDDTVNWKFVRKSGAEAARRRQAAPP